MNIVDKAIGAISPRTQVRREMARMQLAAISKFTNTGYDEGGASRRKKSLIGWQHGSGSPQDDIDLNLDVLRQRSRSLYMSAPIATSAIKTNRTNIIGAGLRLKSRVDYEFLGITKEAADTWEREVERQFAVWADSKFCDSMRLNDFYELQQLAMLGLLMNGEAWAALKLDKPLVWLPSGLRVQLFESDRVSTPNTGQDNTQLTHTGFGKNQTTGNRIYNGVEIDAGGGVVAYWIANKYPVNGVDTSTCNWVCVEAYGQKTGRPNVLQVFESERAEQYRGVPYLAQVIETLKQISRYTEAELTAAVVTAFFTAFITQEGDTTDKPWESAVPAEEQVDADPDSLELGAGTINILGKGENVTIADPKRPASGFAPFVEAMARQIGAALELPYDVLMKSFNSSYSASRAAMMEAWKTFKMRRTWFSRDFCQPIYEAWLAEAVARGIIRAPGYFNSPVIAKAWGKAEWNGPAAGQIDPVKEVNAAILRVASGFSTREKETIELTGGDWDQNVSQVARENELLAEANKVLNPPITGTKGGKFR